jgi:AcrR family transcriptional regulator
MLRTVLLHSVKRKKPAKMEKTRMRKVTSLDGLCEASDEPRKKAATRIFETACDLFYQRGIRAVGVDEIVCQAGVTKPSLYRSFESKDALVAACLESFAADALAELEARIAAAGPAPLDQLRALIAHAAEELAEPDFRGCLMSNAAVEFRDGGHPGYQVIETCKQKVRERLGEITRDYTPDEPDALADGLILLIEGAYFGLLVFGSKGAAKAVIGSGERLIQAHAPK